MELRETMSDVIGPGILTEDRLTAWGERIGAAVEPPLWISLIGPLGAGKSVLARAVCHGAGVPGPIPSPSFTLVQGYRGTRGFPIHHVDLFRLRPGDDIEPLGWEDLIGSEGLILVEWAGRAGDQQPRDRWEVELQHGQRPDERLVTIGRLGAAPELIAW